MRSGTGWQAAGRALFGRRARLRWVHLVLGGALLMPFWLVGTVALGPLTGEQDMWSRSPAFLFGAYGVALPLAAVAGLFPTARRLSVAVARALCGIPGERLADGHARTRAGRVRTAGWCTLHMGVGALVSGTSLALPPFAVALIAVPLFPGVRNYLRIEPSVWSWVLLPLAGTALLLALAAVSAAAGALLARWAQVLLGPTPADRLAAAERRATELAERNRLARELHDSVGHALSAVALQAGAARRVLDSDRDSDVEFVREALAAIEETTRRTVGELDAVLGLLRQDVDGAERPGGPTLGTLDGLLSRSGVRVSLHTEGPLTAVPAPVSREAYRIVQEGLSNVLRHAGASPVTLWIAARDEELEIRMENPLPEQAPVVRPGGGRGLRGVAERATLLGGLAEAGPREGIWRLSARLPLEGRR
ncbi:sensor histidine kinase [Streptomyces peucetius]|uniref:histidine kinase n=1 Tax=Streptomyces peucetius TaxID=1950 RepID=A0ABY6IHE5_STRPE|nr:histidine kinase [Streptomyces peucetius]UYQ66431.1 histidine kinase [Streptomyces peucetius]